MTTATYVTTANVEDRLLALNLLPLDGKLRVSAFAAYSSYCGAEGDPKAVMPCLENLAASPFTTQKVDEQEILLINGVPAIFPQASVDSLNLRSDLSFLCHYGLLPKIGELHVPNPQGLHLPPEKYPVFYFRRRYYLPQRRPDQSLTWFLCDKILATATPEKIICRQGLLALQPDIALIETFLNQYWLPDLQEITRKIAEKQQNLPQNQPKGLKSAVISSMIKES